MAFRTHRHTADETDFFEGWPHYLRARGAPDARLCTTIERLNEPLWRELVDTADTDRGELEQKIEDEVDPETRERLQTELDNSIKTATYTQARTGFPWITLVLGNGCLEALDGTAGSQIAQAPGRIAAALHGERRYGSGVSPEELVKGFAEALLADHEPLARPSEHAEAQWRSGTDPHSQSSDDQVAARTLESAALLCRLYHVAAMISGHPVPRMDDTVTLPTEGGPVVLECREDVVAPLRSSLNRLSGMLAEDKELQFVRELVESIRRNLADSDQPATVRFSQVQLICEIAWHFVARGTPTYPGWSDLLILLSIRAGRRYPTRTEADTLLKWIEENLIESTERSWQTRLETLRGAERTPRDHFYDVAADVLVWQAKLRTADDRPFGDGQDGLLGLPIASAFVTSFDLELEMALSMHSDARPYLVVIPLLLRSGQGTRERIVYDWVGARIDPSAVPPEQRLEQLRSPDDWVYPLTDDYLYRANPGLPVIVRLTGAPLVRHPNLGSLNNRTAIGAQLLQAHSAKSASDVSLHNAVLLDEHTALNHAVAELGRLKDSSIGLPQAVFGTQEKTDARFWMALGVQLGDNAVRYRLAAQLSTEEALDGYHLSKRGQRQPTPDRSGVSVNRRTRAVERDVLHWQGFDVVQSDYAYVVGDLEHYVEHLRKPNYRMTTGEECGLEAGIRR